MLLLNQYISNMKLFIDFNCSIITILFMCIIFTNCGLKKTKDISIREQIAFSEITNSLNLTEEAHTVKVKIKYIDYNENENYGLIEAHKNDEMKIKDFFDVLVKSNFKIAKILPLSEYSFDIEKALSKNITFSVFSKKSNNKQNSMLIFINPAANPIICKNIVKDFREDNSIFGGVKNQNNLVIWPPQGILSINSDILTEGKITVEIDSVIKSLNFNRVLGHNENILFLGLVGFNYLPERKSKDNFENLISVQNQEIENKDFTFEPLPYELKTKYESSLKYGIKCPVPFNRLSYLNISYYNFNGIVSKGSMIVLDVVAENTLEAFKEIFRRKIPIENMIYSSEQYDQVGTSGFSCRLIQNSGNFSLHSYGTAIDINSYHNPFISSIEIDSTGLFATAKLTPSDSPLLYLYRNNNYKFFNEEMVKILNSAGFFIWGGEWSNPIDFMHFQTSSFISKMLMKLSFDDGKRLFNLGVTYPKIINKIDDFESWYLLYQLYPKDLINILIDNIEKLEGLTEKKFYRIICNKLQAISY